ncbi:unnamed protein product, partial [Symbiodinium sp. CCMP2592]
AQKKGLPRRCQDYWQPFLDLFGAAVALWCIEAQPYCLRHYRRRLMRWVRITREFLPPNEQALRALEQLRGEAKQEFEEIDDSRFDHPDGISRLLADLEVSFGEREIFRQGGSIREFESIGRMQGESITAFVRRFRLLERKLADNKVPPYPEQARVIKLLDGLRLDEKSASALLLAAGNKYDMKAILEAIRIQYPAGMSVTGVPKGLASLATSSRSSITSRSTAVTRSSASSTTRAPRARGRGSRWTQWQTAAEDDYAEEPQGEPQGEEWPDEETEPAEAPQEEQGEPVDGEYNEEAEDDGTQEIAEADTWEYEDGTNEDYDALYTMAQALTVSSRKLSSIMQARGFYQVDPKGKGKGKSGRGKGKGKSKGKPFQKGGAPKGGNPTIPKGKGKTKGQAGFDPQRQARLRGALCLGCGSSEHWVKDCPTMSTFQAQLATANVEMDAEGNPFVSWMMTATPAEDKSEICYEVPRPPSVLLTTCQDASFLITALNNAVTKLYLSPCGHLALKIDEWSSNSISRPPPHAATIMACALADADGALPGVCDHGVPDPAALLSDFSASELEGRSAQALRTSELGGNHALYDSTTAAMTAQKVLGQDRYLKSPEDCHHPSGLRKYAASGMSIMICDVCGYRAVVNSTTGNLIPATPKATPSSMTPLNLSENAKAKLFPAKAKAKTVAAAAPRMPSPSSLRPSSAWLRASGPSAAAGPKAKLKAKGPPPRAPPQVFAMDSDGFQRNNARGELLGPDLLTPALGIEPEEWEEDILADEEAQDEERQAMEEYEEVYGGHAHFTEYAINAGLRVLQPIDEIYGQSLRTKADFDHLRYYLLKWLPFVVVWEPPCTWWSPVQHLNYTPDELKVKRAAQERELNHMVDTILELRTYGVHFLIEYPYGTPFWTCDALRRLTAKPEVQLRKGHMCMFDMRTRQGQLLKKPTGWLSDLPELLDSLAVECDGSHEHGQCLGGSVTKQAQVYPPTLARAFVNGVLQALHRCGDERFCTNVQAHASSIDQLDTWHADEETVHSVYFLDITRHQESWLPLLKEAESRLKDLVSTRVTLKPSPYLEQVRSLVPWTLNRVQICRTPKQRRVPNDVLMEGATHRGAVLLMNDATVVMEAEVLKKVLSSPSAKFDRPVKVGIFFYGVAPSTSLNEEDDAKPEPAKAPTAGPMQPDEQDVMRPHEPGYRDISFPGVTDEVPRWMRGVLRRLHVNLGHPAKETLVRQLVLANASSMAIKGARALQCEVCRFSDRVYCDIVFLKNIQGETTIIKALVGGWLCFFGAPDELVLDDEGAFRGLRFETLQVQCGTRIRCIPSDAHWQLGRAERHGQALRFVVSRLVSQFAPTTVPEMLYCGPFEVGQRIAYYRVKNSFDGEGSVEGYRLGTVLAVDLGTSGNVWIKNSRGRIVQAAREQRRPVAGEEEWWTPDQSDLDLLKNTDRDLLPTETAGFDVRGQAPPAAVAARQDQAALNELERQDAPAVLLDADGNPIDSPAMMNPVLYKRRVRLDRELQGLDPRRLHGYLLHYHLYPKEKSDPSVGPPASESQIESRRDSGSLTRGVSSATASSTGLSKELAKLMHQEYPELRGLKRAPTVPVEELEPSPDAARRAPLQPGPGIPEMTVLPDIATDPSPEPILDAFLTYCRDCGEQRREVQDGQSVCVRCNSTHQVDSPLQVRSWFDEALERDAFDTHFEPAPGSMASSVTDPSRTELDEIDYHHNVSFNSSSVTSSQFSHRLQVLHRHARGDQHHVGWDGNPKELQLYESTAFLTAAHHFGDHLPATSSTTSTRRQSRSLSETVAKRLLGDCDFSHDACHQLLDTVDLPSSGRQCLQGEDGSQAMTLGLYSHGNFFGCTKVTQKHRWLCRYLNDYLRSHDNHNLKGSLNWQITLGNYKGGRTWFQTKESDGRTVTRNYFGETIPGYFCNTKKNLVSFSPDHVHATEEFQGERWSIVAYTSRLVTETTQADRSRLCRLGFNPRPVRTAYPTTCTTAVESSDEEIRVANATGEFVTGMENSSEDGNDGTFESGRAARQAKKKELPWKAMTDEEIPQFREALKAEWSEWTKWSSCVPVWLDPKKIPAHLILKSRVCFRWKPKADGSFKPKARIVIAGFPDPHLPLLTRDAPVLSRAGFSAILQWATTHGVRLWNADCKSAFLQGKADTERPEPIFMKPPTDPVSQGAIDEWSSEYLLYKLSAPVYGQANAPRRWYLHVADKLQLTSVEGAFEWGGPWEHSYYRVVPVPFDELALVAYADSGFANAPNHRSQGGLVIVATDKKVLEETRPASMMEWKSFQHQRVLRSTLAAEAASLDHANDHAHYLAMVLSELVDPNFKATMQERPLFGILPVTDARSLWDAVHRLSSGLQEKRVEIDIVGLRQNCRSLRWVPTEEQKADALTKRSRSLRDGFRKFMERPLVTLVESRNGAKDRRMPLGAIRAHRPKKNRGVLNKPPCPVLVRCACAEMRRDLKAHRDGEKSPETVRGVLC